MFSPFPSPPLTFSSRLSIHQLHRWAHIMHDIPCQNKHWTLSRTSAHFASLWASIYCSWLLVTSSVMKHSEDQNADVLSAVAPQPVCTISSITSQHKHTHKLSPSGALFVKTWLSLFSPNFYSQHLSLNCTQGSIENELNWNYSMLLFIVQESAHCPHIFGSICATCVNIIGISDLISLAVSGIGWGWLVGRPKLSQNWI